MVAVLAVAATCSGSGEPESPQLCGTGPGAEPCPPFGLPVVLTVTSELELPHFPPRPDARIALYPGEAIEAKVHGFAPNEEAELYSTNPSYDGLRYRADDDGVVTIPIDIAGGTQPGEQHYLVSQQLPGEDLLAGAFVVVVLGEGLDPGLLDDALGPGQ